MTTATPQQLRTAINEIDGISQGAFSEIAAMARLALDSLEIPGSYSHGLEAIAYVLSAICSKSLDTQNVINTTAGEFGCDYKDEAFFRRVAAQNQAMQGGKV